jgi:hypothetical protein
VHWDICNLVAVERLLPKNMAAPFTLPVATHHFARRLKTGINIIVKFFAQRDKSRR